MAGNTPDLRRLAAGLAREARRQWPGLVTHDDVDRLEKSENTLLVVLRVASAVMKRAGIDSSAIRRAADDASRVHVQELSMESADVTTPGAVTGHTTHFEAISTVDVALHDPAVVSKMPRWFIDTFWPDALRRVACGGMLTDRDVEVALYVVSVARGEW